MRDIWATGKRSWREHLVQALFIGLITAAIVLAVIVSPSAKPDPYIEYTESTEIALTCQDQTGDSPVDVTLRLIWEVPGE